VTIASRYPDFFIVGAQRSGTTSLYEYLRAHAQVWMSSQKEAHFFSQDRVRVDPDLMVRSESVYLKLFARAAQAQLVGEASPSYLWHPEAAQRIYAKQPRAKIIAILRNPIARAYSQFRMDLADGLPPISFDELIRRDYTCGDQVYGTGHLYVELGLYAEQLERYVQVFSPSRVLILSFRELVSDVRTLLRRVAAFLEIDAAGFEQVNAFVVHNQTVAPHNALVAKALHHRSARQIYRTLVPSSVRRYIRGQVFVPRAAPAIDKSAIEFLRAVYTPDWRKLKNNYGDFYDLS
jgi:hypothetical protein